MLTLATMTLILQQTKIILYVINWIALITCVNGIIIDNDADNDGVCDDDEVLGCTDNFL